MFDIKDSAKTGYRRVEVLTGPGRRRRWSVDEKARIVAESLAPEAVISAVARRWQVCPQQVFAWRRAAREGLFALPADAVPAAAIPAFVPIVTAPARPASTHTARGVIEVEMAGAIVRVPPGADPTLLVAVLRAVRAAAAA